jgi:cell division protease FtsH
MFLPEEDKYSVSVLQLESQLASLFGGRVAEEIVFGSEHVTTGASNDIERATSIARNMVTKWGLTEKLGPLTYSEDEDEIFLGRSVTQHKHMSDDTARLIDEEVRRIVEAAHQRALGLVESNLDLLNLMADALMRYETIDAGQIDQIMEGHEPDPPEDWNEGDSDASSGTDGEIDTDQRTTIGGPAEQV